MATVEIELRKYLKRNGTAPLVLRVTSGARVSRKNTGLYILPSQWDAAKRRVNRKHAEFARLNDALDVLVREAEGAKADLIKARQPVTGSAVMSAVFSTRDFYAAAVRLRDSFGPAQIGHKRNYDVMIARLKAFAPELTIEDITPEFLKAFRAHLAARGKRDTLEEQVGLSHNSIVDTLAKMKAVLNTVSLKGEHPFKRFTVGTVQAARVEGLEMADIQKLRRYLPRDEGEQIAKDTFLFSFYAAGMRSADVLQLRWAAVKGDRITYEQSKKQHRNAAALSIPLNPVTSEILSRYPRDRETVFGLVELARGPKAIARQRATAQERIRAALDRIAKACGIEKEVTFKLARTSFSRIANEASGRNVYGIQQAMGHSNVRTTEIYLGSDSRAVDELLRVVYR